MGSLTDVLYESAEVTLREAAYVVIDRIQTAPSPCGNGHAAFLEFWTSGRGVLTLVVPDGLASLVASNMVAEDECSKVTREGMSDVVGELLNIMAGHFLRTAFFGQEDPEWGIPSRLGADEVSGLFMPPDWVSHEVNFAAEGYEACLRLWLEKRGEDIGEGSHNR